MVNLEVNCELRVPALLPIFRCEGAEAFGGIDHRAIRAQGFAYCCLYSGFKMIALLPLGFLNTRIHFGYEFTMGGSR